MISSDKQPSVGRSVLGVLAVFLFGVGCAARPGVTTAMSANERDANRRVVPEAATASGGSLDTAGSSRNDFDFLLGEWDVQITRYAPDGTATQREGSWSARSHVGGKIIEDLFVERADEADAAAMTLRTYCAETQRWEMVYLWADRPASGVSSFVGSRVGDEMHLRMQRRNAEGGVVRSRIRFFEITSDSFSWDHRTSGDNGETWSLATLLTVRRRSGSS